MRTANLVRHYSPYVIGVLFGFISGYVYRNHSAMITAKAATVSDGAARFNSRTAKLRSVMGRDAQDERLKHGMTRAMQSRADGSYILDSDIEWMQMRNKEQEQRTVAAAMAHRMNEYNSFFSAAGINAKDNEELAHHRESIYRAKVQVAQSQTQLLNATTSYDERVEKLLGEKYAAYRDFEASYPARREMESLQMITDKNASLINENERHQIEQLIGKYQAYSVSTLGDMAGPYQNALMPFGGKAFAPTLHGIITTLEDRTGALIAESRDIGLSNDTVTAVHSYYTQQIEKMQTILANSIDPTRARLESMKASLAQLKAAPTADPRLIGHLETSISSLTRARGSR